MHDNGMLVVQFAALEQASADIRGAVNKLQSGLAALDSAAQPLVQTWDGEARDQYNQRQQRWTSSANDLIAILGDIQRRLDDSLAGYVDAERRGAGLFT